MKPHAGFSILAFLVAASMAPAAESATTASIVFSRINWRAVDSSHDTVLYWIKPAGGSVVPLTPVTYHVDYRGGSWSPNGGSVAYEMAPQATPQQSQLFVVDRQGGSSHQITRGPGLHTQASWGPGSTIAFVTSDSGKYCLGAVIADGTRQRILFCPPHTPEGRSAIVLATPQWSQGGKSVYVEAGNYGPGLEPQWYSRVYRVNVYSGAIVLLTEQAFGTPDEGGDSGPVAIAPDGTHGIYPVSPSEFDLVDFATGTRTALAFGGSTPRYSPDGSKIAFRNGSGAIAVMNADGSGAHTVIAHPDPQAEYSVADWSPNGKSLLVNQVDNDRLLQIVDLATGQATTVTKGTADRDAWFHP